MVRSYIQIIPYSDSNYLSIIDIFKHLSIRIDYFTAELYALSNCVKQCKLNSSNTSCVIDTNNLQYCNKKLYGTSSAAINDFLPYMNNISGRQIKLTNLPEYKLTGKQTINVIKNNINSTYDIYPNMYFSLSRQYIYIQNLINTFNALLTDYLVYNNINNSDLNSKYVDLTKKRIDMDLKLEELLGKDNNSINSEMKHYYDSTIYTSVFWTILVTSLLFYSFRKI